MSKNDSEYMRRWRQAHPHACLRYQRQYRERSKENIILCSLRGRSKKAGLPFNLTIEDIVIPPVCPILGIPIAKAVGAMADNSPSVDRMVPDLGYVRGNITIMSMRANRIKNDGTAEEHEAIAKYMREYK